MNESHSLVRHRISQMQRLVYNLTNTKIKTIIWKIKLDIHFFNLILKQYINRTLHICIYRTRQVIPYIPYIHTNIYIRVIIYI